MPSVIVPSIKAAKLNAVPLGEVFILPIGDTTILALRVALKTDPTPTNFVCLLSNPYQDSTPYPHCTTFGDDATVFQFEEPPVFEFSGRLPGKIDDGSEYPPNGSLIVADKYTYLMTASGGDYYSPRRQRLYVDLATGNALLGPLLVARLLISKWRLLLKKDLKGQTAYEEIFAWSAPVKASQTA